MQPEMLERNLKRYGWAFHRLPEASVPTWRSGFESGERVFPLVINLTDTYVSFEVHSLLDADVDWYEWPELLQEMLEINSQMKLASVAINLKGEVTIGSQLPVDGLSYEALETVLGILGYYVDEVSDRLQYLCRELGLYRDRAPLS